MSIFSRHRDEDEERVERAHEAIEEADAGLAMAGTRSREARSRAFALADSEAGPAEISLGVATARADEQLAQAFNDADAEASRTIHRAKEKAASRKTVARERAAADVSKAQEAAAERHGVEMTRAVQLREHASYDPPPAAPASPQASGA